jgi:hypothetical protein
VLHVTGNTRDATILKGWREIFMWWGLATPSGGKEAESNSMNDPTRLDVYVRIMSPTSHRKQKCVRK